MDRAKEPRQNTHNREQDGKGKTYHEVTMEKGPTRNHDKKRNLQAIVTPPGSPDHEPIGEVPEPEAQKATDVDGRRRQGTGQNSTGKRSC